MMNSSRAGLLVLIVGVCTSAEPDLTPRGLMCVFMEYANVTCQWENSEDMAPDTQYILQVNETLGSNDTFYNQSLCKAVFETNCSVSVASLYAHYCIRVTAQSSHTEASSAPLCLNAIDAAKLYAPVFSGLSVIQGKPRCLKVQWSKPKIFPLISEHVKKGLLDFQLLYSTEEQPQPQILDVDLRQTEQCLFDPFTLYTMSVRYRYHSALSHWSDWSSERQARTEEAAPSAAPQLWRLIEKDWRHVTLLWKSLPKSQANGRILGYNVSCRREGSQSVLDRGGCEDLPPSRTSCRLPLPPQRCFCSLSVSNSAGSSLPAVIVIRSTLDREPGAPVVFSVTPLDDFSLEVRWEAELAPPASGFVVEWCAISEAEPCSLHWRRLRPNFRSTIITEGVRPEVRYTVSVRAEFGVEAGPERSAVVYTRQGAPSAGPRLHVTELGSSSVSLQWELVPLEQRHGFVRNYTLFYESTDNNTTFVVVSGKLQQYQLSGLYGVYRIHMAANTDAGQGAAGPPVSVVVDGLGRSVLTILNCSVLSVLTVLMLLTCLRWRQRIKHTLWPRVPDPARSSLSLWFPGTLQKVEAKDSKGPHVQSSTDKDLLSYSNVSLCVLDSALVFPFAFSDSCNPLWTKDGQAQTGNTRVLPLYAEYLRHSFEQGVAQPNPPLSPSSSPYCPLVPTDTQEVVETHVLEFSFNTHL